MRFLNRLILGKWKARRKQFFEICSLLSCTLKMCTGQWQRWWDCSGHRIWITLEARGRWATMEELLQVVTFHLQCYENTVKLCKTSPDEINPSDLTFATKFVAICTFSSRWKGRTQWLTSIWQWTWWKQRRPTGVSSITKSSRLRKSRGLTPWFWLNDGYITFVRPLFKP